MEIIITSIVALVGGGIALRFKVPAGAMVGSMLLVALLNIITGSAYFPQDGRVAAQIAAGAFIGAGIQYKDVIDLRHIIKPVILLVSGMLVLNLIMAVMMNRITGIDIITSLFACAPGGIMDMSLISADLGADTSKVAILQLVRLISVISLFPLILKHISSNSNKVKEIKQNQECHVDTSENALQVIRAWRITFSLNKKNVNFVITSAIAIVTGYAGYLSRIPAGAITFSMLSVAVLNVLWGRGYMPVTARKITQVFAGAIIGERMGYGDLMGLKNVLLPAIILILGFIITNLCLGFFISKFSRLDLTTSLFASAPGGMSDMALIADDIGADAPKVALLQLARLVCVIALFPIIIKYISTFL